MDILPRFYVYVLCRPDGRPFYVGKGQGNRIDNHEAYARRGVRSRCCNVIRKIWRNGGEVVKQKLFTTDDEQTAFDLERQLIAAIGREYLANLTDGGDGVSGAKYSAETWAKVQAAKLGKPRSEACKAKISATLTGRPMPDGWAEKVSAANRGKPWTDRERQNLPASMRVPHPTMRGEKHHSSKVTEAQAREVLRLHRDEGMGPSAIAKQLGINRGTVSGILYSPRDWKWLKDELRNVSS